MKKKAMGLVETFWKQNLSQLYPIDRKDGTIVRPWSTEMREITDETYSSYWRHGKLGLCDWRTVEHWLPGDLLLIKKPFIHYYALSVIVDLNRMDEVKRLLLKQTVWIHLAVYPVWASVEDQDTQQQTTLTCQRTQSLKKWCLAQGIYL